MIIIIWIINFVISIMNAWGSGKSWRETRVAGGWSHFMNWMGAIMSASGFSWCYMLILGFFGASIPIEHEVGGKMVVEPYLSGEILGAFADFGYIIIIFPILGSGIAILIHSWKEAIKRGGAGNYLVAGWNTVAMGNNIYGAINEVPRAGSGLRDFFFGGNKENSDMAKLVVLFLVIGAICGGILTTYFIITATMKKEIINNYYRGLNEQ